MTWSTSSAGPPESARAFIVASGEGYTHTCPRGEVWKLLMQRDRPLAIRIARRVLGRWNRTLGAFKGEEGGARPLDL